MLEWLICSETACKVSMPPSIVTSNYPIWLVWSYTSTHPHLGRSKEIFLANGHFVRTCDPSATTNETIQSMLKTINTTQWGLSYSKKLFYNIKMFFFVPIRESDQRSPGWSTIPCSFDHLWRVRGLLIELKTNVFFFCFRFMSCADCIRYAIRNLWVPFCFYRRF